MSSSAPQFHIPLGMHLWSGFVSNNTALWKHIGNFETRLLANDIKNIPIEQPIFITGLARSGSTLLLEILSSFESAASHRYTDYPFLFTPYFWNNFLKLAPKKRQEPTERAHGDRIMITSDSPEAMEEMLWMAFFNDTHDPDKDNCLGKETTHEDFESFYQAHIKKLLYVRNKNRYVAKNNSNVNRITYLKKLYSDARFIIPIRDPVTHIASLVRQHKRFSQIQQINTRTLKHFQRQGHFEFGLDRRPLNSGNTEEIKQVMNAWNEGEEIKGWALYWSHTYSYLSQTIKNNPELEDACKIIRYEDMCDKPAHMIEEIAQHCALKPDNQLINEQAKKICEPQYYDVDLSDRDIELIKTITHDTASYFGYS